MSAALGDRNTTQGRDFLGVVGLNVTAVIISHLVFIGVNDDPGIFIAANDVALEARILGAIGANDVIMGVIMNPHSPKPIRNRRITGF
jgi:hypothetical protein